MHVSAQDELDTSSRRCLPEGAAVWLRQGHWHPNFAYELSEHAAGMPVEFRRVEGEVMCQQEERAVSVGLSRKPLGLVPAEAPHGMLNYQRAARCTDRPPGHGNGVDDGNSPS